MPEERDVKIVYRRWTILIPIIMIVIGALLLYGFGPILPTVSIFGGLIIFIGILSFGFLFVMIATIELGSRSLKRRRPTPPPLSEELEEEPDQLSPEDKGQES